MGEMLFGEVVLADGLFGALLAFVTAVILGLMGWVLTQAVALGRIVSRLEASEADHERRIDHLEANG